jgi:hypothetical protein
MSRLLISFCNTFPQGFPLAVYDFASGEFAWLPAHGPDQPIGGASGVCWGNGEYYALFQHRVPGWPSTLIVYGPDLNVRAAIRLQRVQDGHSLIWHDGELLVVSTGTNELIRVSVDVAAGTAREESLWALGDERRDCDHVNSVAWWQGRLCAGLHGPRQGGESSFEPPAGRIIDVASQETLWERLLHPHSLLAVDGTLYFAESARGRLWSLQSKEGSYYAEPIKELSGYLRGIAIDGKHLFVASSSQRLTSKSKGTLMKPPHNLLEPTHCVLYRMDLVNGQVEHRDLTPFGREIYDVVLLPQDAPPLPPGSSEAAIIRRQLAYDLEHQRALDDLRKMIEKYEGLLRQSTV